MMRPLYNADVVDHSLVLGPGLLPFGENIGSVAPRGKEPTVQ